ncbi:MAG TPA: hypothetical protein VKM36_00615 [Balneolaceae bacterium]|nr:hypothetical protein [Balneolaceae bacterium]
MNWSKIKGLLFFLVIAAIQTGCQKNEHEHVSVDSSNYLGTEELWLKTLHTIGVEKNELANSVLLITGSTHCPDCLQELAFWTDYYKKSKNEIDLSLIVIERYEERYRNFLNRNNIDIPAFRDSTASITENDLIPSVPVKIHFDKNGNIKRIHSIGSDPALEDFLADFSAIKDH